VPGQGVLVLKRIQNFLERDQDITYYDEFHYIYITLKELLKIIIQHYAENTDSTSNNI
jgi:hypothetical protein